MDTVTQPGHIGIVAVSPEGAALCYRQIFRNISKHFPNSKPPRVTVHNEPFPDYLDCVRRDDWTGVAELLIRSANILHRVGVDFVLTPDNAVQHGVMIAEHQSKVPWLTMTDLVAEALESNNHRTVGILGTRYVTQGSAYQTALGLRGIKLQAPSPEDVDRLDEIIFRELIYGHAKPDSRRAILEIIDRLRERGCEALVVALSEAPLLLDEATASLPTFDAVDLLAFGAIRRAVPG
ncbi:MAG TPA: aspartate racemase [Phycisphaerales bacterium]|nr:aspartate racemase [Phycisphaerales bacterium]